MFFAEFPSPGSRPVLQSPVQVLWTRPPNFMVSELTVKRWYRSRCPV